MPIDPSGTGMGGWSLGGFAQPTRSTQQIGLSPSQVAQIQAQTAQMAQPSNPQQNQMFNGLFNNMNGSNGLATNLGSAGAAFWGSTPAYGGGNILSGDAYGGSAAAPLPGLTPNDYGM